jgi:alpha-tubulin suppressor-like RCC1 family protein
MAVSGGNGCALTTGSTLYCWGDNGHGECGNGGTTNPLVLATPTSLPAQVLDVVGEYYHYCAILTDGTAKCWGEDTFGAIGDNDLTMADKLTPTSPQW